MGYIGAIPLQFKVNLAYQWSRGPDDSMLRVRLRPGDRIDVFEFQENLRRSLPEKVGSWFRDELIRLERRPLGLHTAEEKGDWLPARAPRPLVSTWRPGACPLSPEPRGTGTSAALRSQSPLTPFALCATRAVSALGVDKDDAEERADRLVFAFEPGDLISSTMSLGSPAPIEVVVNGRNLSDTAAFMDRAYEELDKVPSLRDLQIQQTLDYPTVQVVVDRERAGLSGVTARDIGDSMIAATYLSRFTSSNYWRDDISGTSYQVQVSVPPARMTEATDVSLIPITKSGRRPDAPVEPRTPSADHHDELRHDRGDDPHVAGARPCGSLG